MDIRNMVYRTKTYLAGDWTGDSNAIQTLKNWNNNEHLALDFVDVHDLTSSSDSSLKCSIKRSLYERMRITKTFVLVVSVILVIIFSVLVIWIFMKEDE